MVQMEHMNILHVKYATKKHRRHQSVEYRQQRVINRRSDGFVSDLVPEISGNGFLGARHVVSKLAP